MAGGGAKMKRLDFKVRTPEESLQRAREFLKVMEKRRSVRQYSSRSIPEGVLETCIQTASQAPSGANKQPWTFALITNDKIKSQIREAAEEEERAFYGGRAPRRWLDDLAPFGTNEKKEFLEIAPALIVVFAQRYGDDESERHYYVNESVGLAVGFLLASLHNAGFATLTHTPSPMKFLTKILGRPSNERPYLLIPVGYPADDCMVPDIERKPISDFLVRFD